MFSYNSAHRSTAPLVRIPDDFAAFCAYAESRYGLVYSVALAHTRNAEVAQEVTQDVFVRLLLQKDKLPLMDNADAWVARITRNTAVDWIRRRQTHSRLLSLLETDRANAAATPAPAHVANPRELMMTHEQEQALHRAMEHLEPQEREILLLHYMEDVEQKEIATMLGVHPSTVGRRIRASLKTLRGVMAGFEAENLHALRPAAAERQAVMTTLAVVSALSTERLVALSAAAAPLPVLGATSGAGGSGAISGTGTVLSHGVFARMVGSWVAPAIMSAVMVAGVIYWVKQPSRGVENKGARDVTTIAAMEETRAAGSASIKAPAAHEGNGGGRRAYTRHGLADSRNGVTGSQPIPDVPPGTLIGQVLSEHGDALPGVPVTAHLDQGTSQVHTRADAEGWFHFEDIPNGYVYVTASADGYSPASFGQFPVQMPMPPIDYTVTLYRAVTLSGRVVNGAGKPVPGARLVVLIEWMQEHTSIQGNSRNDVFETMSDADGRFEFDALKPGAVNIVVYHPDYEEQWLGKQETDQRDLEIVMNDGRTIQGTAHDGETTLTHALVRLDSGALSKRNVGAAQTTTDANGYFAFHHRAVPSEMRDWQYSITVENDNGSTVPRYALSLKKEDTTVTVAMNSNDTRAVPGYGNYPTVYLGESRNMMPVADAAKGTGGIEGRIDVEDALRPALLQSNVSVMVFSAEGGMFDTRPDADLRFTITGLPPGKYTVLPRSGSGADAMQSFLFGKTSIEVENDTTAPLTITAGSIPVPVRLRNASPGKSYYIVARKQGSDSQGAAVSLSYQADEAANAADDELRQFMLPPGEYELEVGLSDSSTIGNTTTCALSVRSAPARPIEIDLTAQYQVNGTVRFPTKDDAGTKVVYLNNLATPYIAHIIRVKDGTFSTMLPPGEYRLRYWDETHDFRVTDTDLELPVWDMSNHPVAGMIIEVHTGEQPFEGHQLSVILNDAGASAGVDAGTAAGAVHYANATKIGHNRFLVYPLSPGEKALALSTSLTSGERKTGTVVINPVELRAGEIVNVEAHLEPGARVYITPKTPSGNPVKPIDLRYCVIEDAHGNRFVTGISGSNGDAIIITTLSPGRYRARLVSANGSETTHEFEVYPGEEKKEMEVMVESD